MIINKKKVKFTIRYIKKKSLCFQLYKQKLWLSMAYYKLPEVSGMMWINYLCLKSSQLNHALYGSPSFF